MARTNLIAEGSESVRQLFSRDLSNTILDDPGMGHSAYKERAGEIITPLQKLDPNKKEQKEEKSSPAPSHSKSQLISGILDVPKFVQPAVKEDTYISNSVGVT